MFLKLVFVVIVVGIAFELCQTAERQIAWNPVSFFIPSDGRVRAPPLSRSFDLDRATTILDTTDRDSTTTINPTTIYPTTVEENWTDSDVQQHKVDYSDFFDWRLLEKVFTNENTNVVISPFSVKFVLALLAEAADAESETKRELESVFMGSTSTSTALRRENFHNVLQSLLEPSSTYKLNFATKMYLRNNLIPRKKYQQTIKDRYNTDIQCLDFSKSDEAAKIINNWCRNVTEGHLPTLVSSDNIENAVLLIINAIYFDGEWRSHFTERFDSVFFRQPLEQIRAEFMTVTDKFHFFHSTVLNAKILKLPYLGNKFAMNIILPGARGGLDELIREIEGDTFRRIQWLMLEQKIKVTIPKFKFDFRADLKDTLKALGVTQIFSEDSALSGITYAISQKQLKVSDIFQKAGIEVHETGSTAYASTTVEIVNKFGGDPIEEFNANRPFIFLITDEGTSNIIFAGKVLDPTV